MGWERRGETRERERGRVTCLLVDDTATWLLYVVSVVGEREREWQGRKEGRRK